MHINIEKFQVANLINFGAVSLIITQKVTDTVIRKIKDAMIITKKTKKYQSLIKQAGHNAVNTDCYYVKH